VIETLDGEEPFDRLGLGVTSISMTSDGTVLASGAPRREDATGSPTGQVFVFQQAATSSEPSQAPSDAPVTALPTSVLSKFDWDLERIGQVTATFDDSTQANEVTLEYLMHIRDYEITLYEDDCLTTLQPSLMTASGSLTPVSPTHGNLTVNLDLDPSNLVGSPIWNDTATGEGLISMCIRVDLVLPGTSLSVHFFEQKLFLTVGLTQGFRVENVDLARIAPDTESVVAEIDSGLYACQCANIMNTSPFMSRVLLKSLITLDLNGCQ